MTKSKKDCFIIEQKINQRCCTQDMATPSVESFVTLLLSI